MAYFRGSCPAFMKGEYNISYGFIEAAKTYGRTFLPKVTERLNKMSRDYKLTGLCVRSI